MAMSFQCVLAGEAERLKMQSVFPVLLWFALLGLLSSGTCLAAVDVWSLPESVAQGGSAELAGSMMFIVDGDDFASASPGSPVYLRISLPPDVSLSQTLAGPNQPPIHLSLSLAAGGSPGQLVASKTAVSLVRCVAGESAIWIRINEASTTWLELGGQTQAPSPEHPVAFQIGITGQDSFGYTWPLYQLGWANLPFNTTDPETVGNPINSADTSLFIDLSQGAFPEGSQIEAAFHGFSGSNGVETATDAGQIIAGTELEMELIPSALVAMVLLRIAAPMPGLEMETYPQSILDLTACETTGDMTVSIGLDALPNVSQEMPAYLRLQLSNDVTLCETLAGPGAAPIYLALRLPPGSSGQVIAPPETASIVRWVAGEDAIWVKIVHPTIDWALGVSNTPGVFSALSFTIGQSGGESLTWNQTAYASGQANLPANTADPAENDPASTPLSLDFSAGGISAFNPELWCYARTFSQSTGVESAISASQIQLGVTLGHEDGGILGFLAEGPVPWDGVVLSSLPRELQPAGSCEVAGNLGFTIGADLFPLASEEHPIYLRVKLPGDISLCETRVTPGQGDPILLAISLERPESASKVVAPAETASIVRWVAGESEFWLKITQPTGNWLEIDGVDGPPIPEERVKLGLGIDAATTSAVNGGLYVSDKANLPGNTRASNWPASFEAVSTELTLDIHQAAMVPDLQPGGNWRAYAEVAPTAWLQVPGVETQPDLGDVPTGAPFPLFFQGKRAIGYTTTVAVYPPVAVQGSEILTMEALVADDINPVEFKWIDKNTNVIVSEFQSIIFDPVPTGTVKLRLEMRDHLGRWTSSEGTLLVNPGEYDLNHDGKSDIEDLYFALPDWGGTHDILFLLAIPLE